MPRKQNLCAALGAIFADKTITVPVGRAAKLLLSGRVPTAGGNTAIRFSTGLGRGAKHPAAGATGQININGR
jgi:hypothetical protein